MTKFSTLPMKPNEPLTIIIADDDADDREALVALFSHNEQFKVIECFESGIDAIKEIMIKKNIPDILIIDMYMPMLTGTEIVKKLEESGTALGMLKFILSTTINSSEQNKYSSNPTVKFIKKPVSTAELNNIPVIIMEQIALQNTITP